MRLLVPLALAGWLCFLFIEVLIFEFFTLGLAIVWSLVMLNQLIEISSLTSLGVFYKN